MTEILTPDYNSNDYVDPKKSWEIDHEWKYFGISYNNRKHINCLTYKCTYCECFYHGNSTNESRTDNQDQVGGFRPKDSGCKVIWEIENLRDKNKKLTEELNNYKGILNAFNKLLNK